MNAAPDPTGAPPPAASGFPARSPTDGADDLAGLFSPLVERAMRVAARCHRDHRRKASDLPYISHPASVALILARAGFLDDAILAAALLHDVVEDTPYSAEQLAAEFPEDVARYVAVLTERKLDHDGRKRSWQERKEEHVAHVGSAPLPARAVVLADKLHNLGTMLVDLRSGEDLWSRFGAPADRILRYQRAMVAAAAGDDEPLRELAAACRRLIDVLERAAGLDSVA